MYSFCVVFLYSIWKQFSYVFRILLMELTERHDIGRMTASCAEFGWNMKWVVQYGRVTHGARSYSPRYCFNIAEVSNFSIKRYTAGELVGSHYGIEQTRLQWANFQTSPSKFQSRTRHSDPIILTHISAHYIEIRNLKTTHGTSYRDRAQAKDALLTLKQYKSLEWYSIEDRDNRY
jgi:hypothetical protein